jgi:alpha-galactosidase
MPILNQAAHHWNDIGFWGHRDWAMLEVGNSDLTYEESRSHFALWAALKSLLIIGTRLDGIKINILAILKNKELIAFNQDAVYSDFVMPFNLSSPLEPRMRSADTD